MLAPVLWAGTGTVVTGQVWPRLHGLAETFRIRGPGPISRVPPISPDLYHVRSLILIQTLPRARHSAVLSIKTLTGHCGSGHYYSDITDLRTRLRGDTEFT